jgi:hypothetical protein
MGWRRGGYQPSTSQKLHYLSTRTLPSPLLLHFAVAVAVASLVVIPEGDLLLFVAFAFIFRVFGPKIACQVPKPPKSFTINNLHLAF